MRLKTYLDFVKFEHTLFALPFAYLGAILAERGIPSFYDWFWITMAMVGARTAGMALNRIVDRDLDALNPRTRNRPLQTKQMTLAEAQFLVGVAFVLLVISALMLDPLCLSLLPIAAALLFLYSYVKRFSWLTHFVLGLVLACAPVGAWMAVQGQLGGVPILLGLAVVCWVAGFDIIYACQDYEHDRQQRIHSLPVRVGIGKALGISRLLHLGCLGLIVSVGLLSRLGLVFWIGLLGAALFLWRQHRLVSVGDLSRLNEAFFVMNASLSIVLFIAVFLDGII